MREDAPDKPGRLLHTVPHAAQLLDLGVSTIWKLVADGKLSTVKIGRSTRIPHSELARLAGLPQS
jgi:excisionase family DNA binding protein